MKLLDLFCGAGGASKGYAEAGFEVVGVDLKPQPHYPFEFHLADALWFPLEGFQAIHASPPCQHYTAMAKSRWANAASHPDLVASVRDRLRSTGKLYVIENVIGAPLHDPILLCGKMFGLGTARQELRRHRLFETNFAISAPFHPKHGPKPALGVYGHPGGVENRRPGSTPRASTAEWREGMGIDWMSGLELAQAIPPAYTRYIGSVLYDHLSAR